MPELTKEQLAVVNHPDNCHAKILAVAGSGKNINSSLPDKTSV